MTLNINHNGVDRKMTADELAYIEQAQHEAQAAAAQLQADIDAREAARASALAKLAALGLNNDEIAALVGA